MCALPPSASAIQTPYAVANRRVEFHGTDSPLKQGSYRALASTANCFSRESAMDELAHAVGMDPLKFRLHNLKDARLPAVLEAAASRFGWDKAKFTFRGEPKPSSVPDSPPVDLAATSGPIELGEAEGE